MLKQGKIISSTWSLPILMVVVTELSASEAPQLPSANWALMGFSNGVVWNSCSAAHCLSMMEIVQPESISASTSIGLAFIPCRRLIFISRHFLPAQGIMSVLGSDFRSCTPDSPIVWNMDLISTILFERKEYVK